MYVAQGPRRDPLTLREDARGRDAGVGGTDAPAEAMCGGTDAPAEAIARSTQRGGAGGTGDTGANDNITRCECLTRLSPHKRLLYETPTTSHLDLAFA